MIRILKYLFGQIPISLHFVGQCLRNVRNDGVDQSAHTKYEMLKKKEINQQGTYTGIEEIE